MRTKVFALLVAVFLVWAGRTSAQDPSVIQVSGGSVTGESNIYIAQQGDSLWDICDRFFGDPWYWPVLWSLNPHITNPNWIFPGDTINLTPPVPVSREKLGYAISESHYTVMSHRKKVLARQVGFLSTRQVKESGVIASSREEREMLGQFDEVYIRFKGPRKVHAGDKFLVYQVEGKVYHPVTGKMLGYKIRYLGVTKVLSAKTKMTRNVILMAFREMRRGDKVIPFNSINRMVPPVVNGARVSGHVVGGFTPVRVFAEHDYVLIDRGSRDGIIPGNRFIITSRGDGLPQYTDTDHIKDYPREKIGEVMVVYTQKDVCLGVVTYSLHEFGVGAPADMIPGF